MSMTREEAINTLKNGLWWDRKRLDEAINMAISALHPVSREQVETYLYRLTYDLMIGVVEVLKVAQQIIEANRMASPNAAFGIYLVVFLLYFLACWPISLLASYLEKKWR